MLLSSEKLHAEIAQRLPERTFRLEVHDVLSSTNDRVRELAQGDAPEYTLVAAGSQSSGRGTQGRSFFSPADTGVYMSLLLRPAVLENPGRITVTAAVAVSRA
ncbi:MAG: biotin--[Oscillospiraceae bacterium]|nr:biotin--[acetyl-CoA-carboxylase] ligase [Oscillospiraceae bacterium]